MNFFLETFVCSIALHLSILRCFKEMCSLFMNFGDRVNISAMIGAK